MSSEGGQLTSEGEHSGLTPGDRRVVRAIATQLRQIFQGREVESHDVDRRDELGILANMVNRAARELWLSRRRDEQQRRELEARLAEIEQAQDTERLLLGTINDLSAPVLNIYQGVLLLPLVGALDSRRAAHIVDTLLTRISSSQAQVVILDITGVPLVDTQVANALLQATRAAGLLGARIILCGIMPEVAQVLVSLGIDMASLTPTSDLQMALTRALKLVGARVSTTGPPR